jgi:hypothetical protein
MRVSLKISKLRVWLEFLLFLLIDEIDTLNLIFYGCDKGKILMIFAGLGTAFSSLAFFITLVFVFSTPIDIIT